MASETPDPSLLQTLPDDVFALVSRSLSPKDISNLTLSCRTINAIIDSEKVWFRQCDLLAVLPPKDLIEWRKGVSSYKALCRFLTSVRPLIGIWVHQNPELGNVVYVMPGFVSVVGCRIIPQELGSLGIEDGPILWAPVFEVIGDSNGSSIFLLHGREKGSDCFYPGSVKIGDKNCNVLLLEVQPLLQKDGGKLMYSKSFGPERAKICGSESDTVKCRSQRVVEVKVQFNRLGFSDRRKLLEIVTSQVRQKVPDSVTQAMFPRSRDDDDVAVLFERRSLLLQFCSEPELPSDPTQLELTEIRKAFDRQSSSDDWRSVTQKRKSIYGKVRDGIKQILRKSTHNLWKNDSFKNKQKHAQLHEFLRSGDTIGLALHATAVKLSSYRAWPNMHDSRFALYKLPLWVPQSDQEYVGLWGGSFGWPPGRPPEDKPGKALFFLMLSYEESQGERVLIATKILEGTHYVLHPNGSAMFVANMGQPSTDPFPWDCDSNGSGLTVEDAFLGEGIANGYGFRYPGTKPGSLFVMRNGLLAFIWKESRAVLTLQRLNLQELLKKGERVLALPAMANFSYLTKSYSNVFAGFSNSSTSSASPRQRHV